MILNFKNSLIFMKVKALGKKRKALRFYGTSWMQLEKSDVLVV